MLLIWFKRFHELHDDLKKYRKKLTPGRYPEICSSKKWDHCKSWIFLNYWRNRPWIYVNVFKNPIKKSNALQFLKAYELKWNKSLLRKSFFGVKIWYKNSDPPKNGVLGVTPTKAIIRTYEKHLVSQGRSVSLSLSLQV